MKWTRLLLFVVVVAFFRPAVISCPRLSCSPEPAIRYVVEATEHCKSW